MDMKTSDVLDRWTINLMKARVDENAMAELTEYDAEVDMIFRRSGLRCIAPFELLRNVVQLMEANAKIWVKESAMRGAKAADGSDLGIPLDVIGKTALEIRDLNKLRVAAKHAIDQLYGELPDVKVDHASA